MKDASRLGGEVIVGRIAEVKLLLCGNYGALDWRTDVVEVWEPVRFAVYSTLKKHGWTLVPPELLAVQIPMSDVQSIGDIFSYD